MPLLVLDRGGRGRAADAGDMRLCAACFGAPGMSDKEKAKIQEKRAFQKDTDDAYQSTMSRLPDVKQQKVDPWGNMRAAPQK